MVDLHTFSELPQVQGELLEIHPGRRLSVAHWPGTYQADTVVFFGHGGGRHKDQWRELWRSLAEQGYSLVVWDLLGHGDSEKATRARSLCLGRTGGRPVGNHWPLWRSA
ncbi:alpha/beta hydrolase [Pseudomonas citri]|uniref:alpha/beta hydrolase n=1 Tax=Pseudomonas citri TaxID=2978349 RepID=UPI0021B5A6CF|nr:alpha/beta fold hydrolase [Pseudomonas citri]HJR28155.1 alpha/beta fold hydrolase [Pseudomonas sp.]